MSDLAAAAMAASLVFGAGAEPSNLILDQEYIPDPDAGAVQFSEEAIAQTFTVGIGGRFVAVSIRVNPLLNNPTNDPFTLPFEIRTTTDGVPDLANGACVGGNPTGSALACTEVEVDIDDVWVNLDFWDDSFIVNEGTQLAILQPGGQNSGMGGWVGQANPNPANGYPGGEGFVEIPGQDVMVPIAGPFDFAFKTFMVPTPTTLSLLMVGIAGLIGARRIAKR